jgi:hypothetical protein
MTHAEMEGLYELYALGLLESDAVSEVEAHFRDECAYCLEHVGEAFQITSGLATLVESAKPPERLRERVLSQVKTPKRRMASRFIMGGLIAACIALGAFSLWSTGELHTIRDQLSAVRSERDELRSAIRILTAADTRTVQEIREQLIEVRDERNRLRAVMQVLSRSDTRVVQFGRAENAPHGRVFVNGAGGLVFVGSDLPALASNRTFELWLIPKKGAPQPAGLFRPNTSGESVHVSPVRVNASATAAVAVSVEPQQGSSAPTTKPILVVPLA